MLRGIPGWRSISSSLGRAVSRGVRFSKCWCILIRLKTCFITTRRSSCQQSAECSFKSSGGRLAALMVILTMMPSHLSNSSVVRPWSQGADQGMMKMRIGQEADQEAECYLKRSPDGFLTRGKAGMIAVVEQRSTTEERVPGTVSEVTLTTSRLRQAVRTLSP
jgi:hypothetical protein